MVVKSATKKRLMDDGWPEMMAHTIADDRKYDDIQKLWPREIESILHQGTGQPVDIATLYNLWFSLDNVEIMLSNNYISIAFNDRSAKIKRSPQRLIGLGGPKWDFSSLTIIEDSGFRGLGSLFNPTTIKDYFTIELTKEWPQDLKDGSELRIKYPKDADGHNRDDISDFLNPLSQVSKVIDKMEKWFEIDMQSINRQDILGFIDPTKDYDGWDGLGSLFG